MGTALRVGVIGVGQMGMLHARVYKKIPHVELAAVCELDGARRAEAANALGCKAYKDYGELLSDPSIDAVSIVLPDNMHRDCVEAAAARGKHIMLEKPLASMLADGEAIYRAVKDYGKVFTVGFILRFDARYGAVKQAVADGRLGDIIHINCRRNSPITGPRRYIGASDLSMHVMIHDIDFINWCLGETPVAVFAKGRGVLLKEHGMKDVIYALLTYGSGVVACIEACWVLPENCPTVIDDKFEIVGTAGAAYVDSCDNGVRFIGERASYPDSRHWYEINGAPGGDLFEELTAFVNNILDGTRSVVTAAQALDSLRAVDAIERSMRECKEVSV